MALGMGMNYVGLDAVAMLFWAAVVNGVLAPPLIVLVILLTGDAEVMGTQTSSRLLYTSDCADDSIGAAAGIARFMLSNKGIG